MNPEDLPPLEKDTFDTPSPPTNQPLSEKNFIRNSPTLTSLPFWVWLFLIAGIAAILFGSRGWYETFLQNERKNEPFLEVTNREFSLFLWQFPSFLKINAPKKLGYLTGFLSSSENFSPATADEFVSAPPALLFLYHTWHRLLAPEWTGGPISPHEFEEFLQKQEEWQPDHWKQAPQEYHQLVTSKTYLNLEDLQTLPASTLPLVVRQAFQGWKNYFKEGSKINEWQPTVAEVLHFLDTHPSYNRNFWRNIDKVDGQEIAGLNYLSLLLQKPQASTEIFPSDQLAPFLKVAMFKPDLPPMNGSGFNTEHR